MAPNPPEQKRKRGRPAGASKTPQNASNQDAPADNDADDAEDESRPRKRGRKAGQIATDPTVIPEAQEEAVKRKGRPPKQRQEQKQVETSGNAPEPRRMAKKSAVPSKDHARPIKGTDKPDSTTDAPASSQPRLSERGRQLRNPDEENGAKRPNTSQSGPSLPKPRKTIPNEASESEPTTATSRRWGAGRNVRDPDEGRPVGPKEADAAQPTNKAKSKKPIESTREETNSARQGADDKKRRLRPPANTQENTHEDTPESRKANKEKTNKTKPQDSVAGGTEAGPSVRRGRPKASAPSAQEVDTGGPSESRAPLREEGSNTVKRPRQKKEAPPKPHQNESSTEDEASEDSEDEPDFPFRYFKQEMRTVARSTIASKWNRLDAPAINVVSSFLADAQRPVLFRLQDTNRRREHASAAMGVASRRIRTRLTRGFPFPAPTMGTSSRAHPKNYEDEFDFERTVDTKQNLENTLNPLLHSISLLEKEIKKQEDALAKDYNSLHKLEHNARSKTREWREKAKREHALAPGVKPRDGEPRRELGDQLELVSPVDDRAIGGVFITDLQDEELDALSRQIGNHMESLKSNLHQVDGVVPAITKSKAALQQVLLKHLGEEQYGRVLLG